MYAMVRRFEGVTEPAEVVRRVNHGLVPLINQIPGFLAYYWIDAGDGVMVSTSIFADRAGIEESDRRAGLGPTEYRRLYTKPAANHSR